MRRLLKYFLYLLGAILLIAVGLIIWIVTTKPNVGPPENITIERTPERIEHGKYLANHVMVCMDCHSERDYSLFSGPIVPGKKGSGGEVFDQKMGFPGRFISPNITPAGIGDWTDGEVYRAITTGVTKDGKALFPVMPYPNYGKLDPEDIKSVIAYIRTIKPVETQREKSKADFPMNIIIHTMPKKAQPMKRPDPSDKIAYGEYLVTAASCGECHTRREKGKIVGKLLAGGQSYVMPDGSIVTSHNLTPDKTGLGDWTQDMFIEIFKQYADSTYLTDPVKAGEMQTIMPWIMFSGMKESDLAAIYDYLRTLEPIENEIVQFQPPGQ